MKKAPAERGAKVVERGKNGAGGVESDRGKKGPGGEGDNDRKNRTIEIMKKLITTVAVALVVTQGVQAQNLQKAAEFYKSGLYSEAAKQTEGAKRGDAEAIRTLCALQLKTANAEKMADAFVKQHHENAQVPQVRFLWAQNLFDEQRYEEAAEQLRLIKPAKLRKDQRAEYQYKLGYSAYSYGSWDLAKEILPDATKEYSDYNAPSCFTLGYIYYAQSNFPEAEKWFKKCVNDYRFKEPAQFYILECRFNDKDYDYVINNGEALLQQVSEDRKPRVSSILSESFLVRGNVEKAKEYYQESLGGERQTRSDIFRAGEIAYLSGEWQAAVDNFQKMGEKADSLGQIANYQMGFSYIQLHNKVAAMGAFKDASAQMFQADIQEDAFYNYAKLAFDLGKDTQPFAQYLKRYQKRNDTIYSYMAMAALTNHDYEAAVDAYDHIDELDDKMKSNYMKAYFLRARELMEAGSWRMAAPLLKSASYYSPKKDGFNQLCRYYLAESLYRDGKWADARTELIDLNNLQALRRRPEGELIPYQLAYTYFKEANYENALKWFNKYLESISPKMGADAQTRVADCYFFAADYKTALEAYEKQMSKYPERNNLYPRYRAGVASGLLDRNRRKISILEPALEASTQTPYYGECLYELGRAYVAVKEEADAIKTFQTLHSQTTDPVLKDRSLLELGMIERNAGRKDKALDYYKQVVARGGEFREDALLAIEAIYRTSRDPDGYLAYVNSLGSESGRTEEQKEDVYFSSAEQIFLTGDYAKAATTLQSYLERYPEAAYAAKANFYLAECYKETGNKEQAMDYYQKATEQGLDGALGESALLNFATLNYETGRFDKAYAAYDQLRESAKLDANRHTALVGQMRSAYRARMWDDAIVDATTVLNTFKDAPLVREARYVKAKSLLSCSRREEAFQEFQTLAKEPSTNEGAEANYLIIEDLYNRAQFETIQDKVYAFSEKAGGQNYWLAKAFIVLGDSFADQGNRAQAKATFESIKNGYTSEGPQDDVLDQVNLRLSKLN